MRWQELTELLDEGENRMRALEFVAMPSFAQLGTDKRFEALYDELRVKSERGPDRKSWSAEDGTRAARVIRTGKKLTLTFDDRVAPQFGDFVRERLQALYDEYKAGRGQPT